MRILLAAILLVAFTLGGCITTIDDKSDFERTCPVWHVAPGSPKWRNTALIYNATGASDDIKENPQHDKWIVTTTVGGFDYHNGTLDFIELDLKIDYIIDSKIYFQVYTSEKGEPVAYDEDKYTMEEFMEVTGRNLQFRDMTSENNPLTGRITFGPAFGHDEFITNVTGNYRVELTNGYGDFDPSNIRVDVIFEADQDKNPNTDSAAGFEMSARMWYRHHDCS